MDILIGAGLYLVVGYIIAFFYERLRLRRVASCLSCGSGGWCGEDDHDKSMTSLFFLAWWVLLTYRGVAPALGLVVRLTTFLWDNLGPSRAARGVDEIKERAEARNRGVVIIPGNGEVDD